MLEAASRVGGWVHSVRHDDGSVFELGPRSIRPIGNVGYNTLLLVWLIVLQIRRGNRDNLGIIFLTFLLKHILLPPIRTILLRRF